MILDFSIKMKFSNAKFQITSENTLYRGFFAFIEEG